MKYRKLPVEIEAIRFYDKTEVIMEIQDFMDSDILLDYSEKNSPKLIIETLEGNMIALEGDYIIKGIQGEFYPCKPDIFEKTYEAI